MKLKIFFIIPLSILLIFGFLGFRVFTKQKIDFKNPNQLDEEFQNLSSNYSVDKETTKFEMAKDNCKIIAKIKGNKSINEFEIRVSFITIPITSPENEIREKRKKIECIQFSVKTFTNIFESKKTKQNFIKLAKELFDEFRTKNSSQKQFLDKTVKIRNEKGDLIISIS